MLGVGIQDLLSALWVLGYELWKKGVLRGRAFPSARRHKSGQRQERLTSHNAVLPQPATQHS
jgi:hypothetical protein